MTCASAAARGVPPFRRSRILLAGDPEPGHDCADGSEFGLDLILDGLERARDTPRQPRRGAPGLHRLPCNA